MEKYNKNELENLILEQNYSYASIGKKYGVCGGAIKKAAKKLGIELPRRRSINPKENFSHKGKRSYKNDNFIQSKINKVTDEKFISIISNELTWKDISLSLGYKNGLSSERKNAIMERCTKLGIVLNPKLTEEISIEKLTKEDLFKKRKNWQSARSAIQKNARKVFFENTEECKCAICGYTNHIEIAHIKAVSEFDGSDTIEVINSIDNLIALCPNHHWEYDNGILKI